MEGIGIEVLGMGYYQEEGGGNIVWTIWKIRQGINNLSISRYRKLHGSKCLLFAMLTR